MGDAVRGVGTSNDTLFVNPAGMSLFPRYELATFWRRDTGAGGNLEQTVTRNNLEAAEEIVRQLRLRDIGGIIIIDFIDMARPRNRRQVLETLDKELETDRTKTYIVELSPLGLVEMTRQNVTEGLREILTKTCPMCSGEGVIVSEETMAIDIERRLRRLAADSASEAFLVEAHPKVAAMLIGQGGAKLKEIEQETHDGMQLNFETDAGRSRRSGKTNRASGSA